MSDKQVTVIPNGVEFKKKIDLTDDKLLSYDLENGNYCLYIGRISPEKGVLDLKNAYRSSNIGQKLVIVGADSGHPKYFAEIKKSAGNYHRIIFAEKLYGNEKAPDFKHASYLSFHPY
jgi:glycosyltransferase involved in cell wall biosynthesis